MGEKTGINWCHHTRNYWMGCSKVSPGCDFCYAERLSRGWGHAKWGEAEPRAFCGEGASRDVRKWNAKAEKDGVRRRLFVNSFSDVLDHRAEQAWRNQVMDDAWNCPFLDFLLLTKRIGNAPRMLPAELPPNVWMGFSAVNSEELHRDIGKLKKVPASVHWVSFEPAIGPLTGPDLLPLQTLDWIVWGGESGPQAREIDLNTIKRLSDWHRAEILPPLWIKQFGEKHARAHGWKQKHGADLEEWPEWARIQEVPIAPFVC